MTRLLVLSDTHIHLFTELALTIQQALSSADLIIHTGDFTGIDVLNGLRMITTVKAVRGNMDYYDIRHELPEQDEFEVNGKKLGIIHGWGSPWGIEEKIRQRFGALDIIIYGHTHQSRDEIIDGVHFFNAGSARDTYGIIDVDQDIKTSIVAI